MYHSKDMAEEHLPSSGIRAVIDQLNNNPKLSLDVILNDTPLKRRLAEFTAWEKYSKETVPILWDEIQERIAAQRAERYSTPPY